MFAVNLVRVEKERPCCALSDWYWVSIDSMSWLDVLEVQQCDRLTDWYNLGQTRCFPHRGNQTEYSIKMASILDRSRVAEKIPFTNN